MVKFSAALWVRVTAHWWRVVSVLVVLVGIYYLALPTVAGRLLASGVVLVGGAGLCLAGVRHFRPRRAHVWCLLAGAVALTGVGDVSHGAVVWSDGLDRLPPLAGIAYLGAYLLQVGASTGMARARWGWRSHMELIDGLIVAMAVALVSWKVFVAPHDSALGIEPDAGFLSLLVPTMSVSVVWVIWRFVTHPRPGPFAARVLLAAVTLMGVGATAALVVSDGLTKDPPLWFLGVFPLANLLVCTAALHPSMVQLTEPVEDQRRRRVWGRIATLTAAVVVGIGVVIAASRAGEIGALVGGAVLILLVVLRLAMVLHLMDRQLQHRARFEARYRSVLESLEEGVLLQNERGAIVDANVAASRITGVDLQALARAFGTPTWTTIALDGGPLPSERRPGHVALDTGEPQIGFEMGVVRPDGEVRWIELNSTCTAMPAGDPDRLIVSSFRDITERIRLAAAAERVREQLAVAEADAQQQALDRSVAEHASRAKNEFLSRMSHELRTPLNAVLGFGQLLTFADLPEASAEHVSRILDAGQHLLGLIDEVLDISRIELGQFTTNIEPVSVDDAIVGVMDLVRPQAETLGVTLDGLVAPLDLWMCADRRRFQQVMVNLLSNAVKYNRPGGHVRITARAPDAGHVDVAVTDTGRGIAPDHLERVFEPFERVAAPANTVEGTGIGLTVVRSLVEAMHGQVSAESTVGVGSTFTLTFPIAATPPDPIEPRPPVESVPGVDPGLEVLYVEDNEINRVLMQEILRARPNVHLHLANDGRQALELANATPPDLILLDLHLPDMDGQEVFRCLRSGPRTSHIPVAAVTAAAQPGVRARLEQLGIDNILTKPFQILDLLELIDEAERRQSARWP